MGRKKIKFRSDKTMYDFLMGLFVFTFLVVIILVILLNVFWILKLKSNKTND